MELLAVVGMFTLFALFNRGHALDDSIRKLKALCAHLSAMIEDLETMHSHMKNPLGRKRKRHTDLRLLCLEVAHGKEVLEEARSLLTQSQQGFPHQRRCILRNNVSFGMILAQIEAVQRSVDALAAYNHSALGYASCGNHIPAKQLVGQEACKTMGKLKALLLDPKIEGITICGMEGTGKTALMKHLHNHALKLLETFDHVMWVTCPYDFNINALQDVVAAALDCDLSATDDLYLRANKLSEKLAYLGTSVIFLDAVPATVVSLEQIRVSVLSEETNCKLVITTRSTSVCGSSECYETVQINPVKEEDAIQLFMQEAGIDAAHCYLLNDIPKLVAKQCCGVPGTIVDKATSMRGINDIVGLKLQTGGSSFDRLKEKIFSFHNTLTMSPHRYTQLRTRNIELNHKQIRFTEGQTTVRVHHCAARCRTMLPVRRMVDLQGVR